jgi:hypothetical protein
VLGTTPTLIDMKLTFNINSWFDLQFKQKQVQINSIWNATEYSLFLTLIILWNFLLLSAACQDYFRVISFWYIGRLNFYLVISPITLFYCFSLLVPHITRPLWRRLLSRRTAPYIITQLFSCHGYIYAFCGCKNVSF